jgi:hypothetical protein
VTLTARSTKRPYAALALLLDEPLDHPPAPTLLALVDKRATDPYFLRTTE